MADSNPAFTYCTGPVHVFVRVPYSGASPFLPNGLLAGSEQIGYLGTTEVAPEIDWVNVYRPVFNAIGGEMVPFDHMYQGTVVQVRLDLERRSETVLDALVNVPNMGRGFVADDGDRAVGDVGKLMVSNGRGFEMWLVNTFWKFNVPNLAAMPDLHPGLYFNACKTDRHFRGREGLMESKAFIQVEPMQVYDARARGWRQWSTHPDRFRGLPDPL
jgi:hypothetical protein